MQLFLPPCGYSCCHAAAIPAICGFTCFYSFQLHHLVVLVSRPFSLSCIQLFLLPCSYIPYPCVAKLPCRCSDFIPRAWPFYCSRFTAPRCLYCLSQSHTNHIPARVAYYSYFASLVEDCQCSYS